jgi:hypothetical protein
MISVFSYYQLVILLFNIVRLIMELSYHFPHDLQGVHLGEGEVLDGAEDGAEDGVQHDVQKVQKRPPQDVPRLFFHDKEDVMSDRS